MALNPIPPQAYTKDTLQKAYSWLLNQGPEIKEMASNQEILVSLYLQATRNGVESLERPSIQNFRTELKSLADMIGNFDSTKKSAQKATKASSTASLAETPLSNSKTPDPVSAQKNRVPSAAKPNSAYSTTWPEMPAGITPEQLREALAAVYESTLASNSTPMASPNAQISALPKDPHIHSPDLDSPLQRGSAISEKIVDETPFVASQYTSNRQEFSSLDVESLQKIAEIQTLLNLSNKHEAIRALIAIGYKKFKSGLDY